MKISNEYIRGLVDGEGCFTFYTNTDTDGIKRKIPAFAISMHERDKSLLESVKHSLGLRNKVYIFKSSVGDGMKRGKKAVLVVRGLGSLKNTIIPLFYKRLVGHKGIQFIGWLEKIGQDPLVPESYKLLYRLYKAGYWDRNPKFID